MIACARAAHGSQVNAISLSRVALPSRRPQVTPPLWAQRARAPTRRPSRRARQPSRCRSRPKNAHNSPPGLWIASRSLATWLSSCIPYDYFQIWHLSCETANLLLLRMLFMNASFDYIFSLWFSLRHNVCLILNFGLCTDTTVVPMENISSFVCNRRREILSGKHPSRLEKSGARWDERDSVGMRAIAGGGGATGTRVAHRSVARGSRWAGGGIVLAAVAALRTRRAAPLSQDEPPGADARLAVHERPARRSRAGGRWLLAHYVAHRFRAPLRRALRSHVRTAAGAPRDAHAGVKSSFKTHSARDLCLSSGEVNSLITLLWDYAF